MEKEKKKKRRAGVDLENKNKKRRASEKWLNSVVSEPAFYDIEREYPELVPELHNLRETLVGSAEHFPFLLEQLFGYAMFLYFYIFH